MNSELAKTVKDIAYATAIAIPNLLLFWKAWKESKKPDPQLRLIRNKARQEKVKVQSKATLQKLQIEEAAIKEEIKHLARIKGIEIGVAEIEKKESVDLLASVKDKVSSVTSELSNKVDLNKFAKLLNKDKKDSSK